MVFSAGKAFNFMVFRALEILKFSGFQGFVNHKMTESAFRRLEVVWSSLGINNTKY